MKYALAPRTLYLTATVLAAHLDGDAEADWLAAYVSRILTVMCKRQGSKRIFYGSISVRRSYFSIWGKWFAPLSKARRLVLRTNAGLL